MTHPPPLFDARTLATRWGLAAVAATLAEGSTYPLDLLKTRLQLQHELAARDAGPKLSLRAMALSVARNEGVSGLFAGCSVALARQWLNAGISVGLYPSVRGAFLGQGELGSDAPLAARIAAGATTGCIAQAIANPLDVVKVRVQAAGRVRVAAIVAARSSGALPPPRLRPTDVVRDLLAREGLRGFATALGSSVWRAAIINAAGIASYDHTKHAATRAGAGALVSQLTGALVCGLVSAIVSAPLDVVKSRLMANPTRYKGPNDALRQLIAAEGAASLYKGFVPTYQRQAVFNFLFWLSLEELQRLTGTAAV